MPWTRLPFAELAAKPDRAHSASNIDVGVSVECGSKPEGAMQWFAPLLDARPQRATIAPRSSIGETERTNHRGYASGHRPGQKARKVFHRSAMDADGNIVERKRLGVRS